MHPLKKVADGLVLPVLRALVRWQVARDLVQADPAACRLLNVLSHVLADDFADADQAWFVQVEQMRARLGASQEHVRLMDYGAGSPDSTRTAEEMQRGVVFESTIGDICRRASKPPFWARLLYAVVREYEPKRSVELGTCLAISASYQAAALQLVGKGGTLHTLEGDENLAKQSRRNLAGLKLDNVTVVAGRFDQTLDGVLRGLGSVDYAFIDGHHDEHATVGYFLQLLPFLSPGAVLVFDDISWSPGMRRAWQVICADTRVSVAVDLRAVGLCLIGTVPSLRSRYRFWLP